MGVLNEDRNKKRLCLVIHRSKHSCLRYFVFDIAFCVKGGYEMKGCMFGCMPDDLELAEHWLINCEGNPESNKSRIEGMLK